MSLDRLPRANSVLSEKEFRKIHLQQQHARTPYSDVRRLRARRRWQTAQRQVQSATAAFSAAGQERRRAFVQRSWFTIQGPEVNTRSQSLDIEGGRSDAEEDLLPKNKTRNQSKAPTLRQRVQDKSVSFSFDDDAPVSVAGGTSTMTPRRYTYR